MDGPRLDHELAQCVAEWGWVFHHLGVPTSQRRAGERYLPQFKFHVSGFATSPVGVEWMRFDADSPIHPLIQTVPHLAFVVQDLEYELRRPGFTIITHPNDPSDGVRVAMIEQNGAPVELMQFAHSHDE